MTLSRVLATAASMVFTLAAWNAHAADAALSGIWLTAEGHGEVAFKSCGEAVCGYLIGTGLPDTSAETLLIDRLTPTEQGWSGGRIRDPRSGRFYAGAIEPMGEGRLKVTGCLVRPLCRSQVWYRVR